jgi:predicted dehydrogenase
VPRVKIVGAGSIGNHLTHAFRQRDFEVTLCDVDPEALRRSREEIHPARYGAWDPAVRLVRAEELAGERFDVVAIGTPPDSHLPLALAELRDHAPRVLLIEKPLCPPDLGGCDELVAQADAAGCFVGVGYNHTLTAHTVQAERWLAERPIGAPLTLEAQTREHWGGIFAAHPWLDGPRASYLGQLARGGGALCEHSHALHLWQHFARRAGAGRVVQVLAALDLIEAEGLRYDRVAQLHLRTEEGLLGSVVQDVVTDPPRKWLRLQGERGFLEWEANAQPGEDHVRCGRSGEETEERRVKKTRADDFLPEAEHTLALLEGRVVDSPLALGHALETMQVIAAALRSSAEGRAVGIDWSRAPGPGALD